MEVAFSIHFSLLWWSHARLSGRGGLANCPRFQGPFWQGFADKLGAGKKAFSRLRGLRNVFLMTGVVVKIS